MKPDSGEDLKLEAEREMLSEARSEVGFADHKASMVLAALSIGFSAFLGGVIASDWEPSDFGTLAATAWWLGALFAAAAVGLAAAAVWPRTGDRSGEGSIYFWGQAAEEASVDELSQRLDDHPVDPTARVRNQLFALSKIVRRKYRYVRLAMLSTGVAGVLFGLAGLLEL